MNHTMIIESQNSRGDRAIGVLYYGVAVVQCVFVPRGTLNVLSELWQFFTEVASVKDTKNNEQGVWMFVLHVNYLVG